MRSFHACADDQAEHAADQADRTREEGWDLAVGTPFDEVLRVQREHEQPEPPELVAEHLEAGETDGRRGTGGHLTDRRR